MMGAGLAKAAYAAASALEMRDHAPVRLFVYMALTALDSDPRPSFYGGRDALADALAAPQDVTGHRSVKKAVRALTAAGLIQLSGKPAPGRPGRYLLLDGRMSPLGVHGDPSGIPVAVEPAGTGTPDGSVNSAERGPLRVTTGTPEGSERGPLKGPPRRREEKEEEARTRATPPLPPPITSSTATPRTCTVHSSWEHSIPCRACGTDRRAAETAASARRPATMSEPRGACKTGHRFDASSGYCTICGIRDDQVSERAA
ncbi:hypothetical protein GCM10009746_14150 [Microbacterium paludicola]